MTPTQRKDAVMGAAYDFRDAHICGSANLKLSAHAALEAAVDAALAEPAPEPAAWMHEWADGEKIPLLHGRDERAHDQPVKVTPLYAAPAHKPTPIPLLTDAEISDIAIANPPNVHTYGRAIEQAVRQKAGAAHAAKMREPVAAQQRRRHPQKGMPGWSPWREREVANRPAWEIDSMGWEVEYRLLYTAAGGTNDRSTN